VSADRGVVKIVVGGLVGIAVVALGLLGALALLQLHPDQEIVTALLTTLSGAVGAVAGLLAHTGHNDPVPVTTQPGDVVATADVTSSAGGSFDIHPDAPEVSDL
jgi:hypothetical protein